jgi:ABC-type lipoprotein export system ATPase subunit
LLDCGYAGGDNRSFGAHSSRGDAVKITRLHIQEWRNFRDISFEIPEEISLVCLVGENGTGKSNLLELIGGSAHHFGISAGIESHRGNPFEQPHSISLTLSLGRRAEELLGQALQTHPQWPHWDRTITLTRSWNGQGHPQAEISAGGIGQLYQHPFADNIVQSLSQAKETHYLFLDADRSYPSVDIQAHAYVDALKQNWDTLRRQLAFRTSRTMYDDWLRFFLARETQQATKLMQAWRHAKETGETPPDFIDPFASYKTSLRQVLPHLTFVGADTERMTLLFDTAGVRLRFSHLSGGEREIAFLVGQIERFQLRRGFLLVDEPELHLNPDLVRAWVTFLRDTVQDGQVWIATHSLEAAEVAGRDATLVMERDRDTRLVRSVTPLRDRPVLATLAGALGSPAFSLSQLRFVFVEGDRETNERERFHKLCGGPEKNRFMEAGNGRAVLRKLAGVQQLAEQTDQQLHVGAVLDRDYKTDVQVEELTKNAAVFVLGCHEVENLFLHPDALARLLARAGNDHGQVSQLLCDASDHFAGAWILHSATADNSFRDMPQSMRQEAWQTRWASVQPDISAFAGKMSQLYESVDTSQSSRLHSAVVSAARRYEAVRVSQNLWKVTMGKQAMRPVAVSLGFKDAETLEKHVLELWRSGDVSEPSELLALRDFVSRL